LVASSAADLAASLVEQKAGLTAVMKVVAWVSMKAGPMAGLKAGEKV